MLLGLQDHLGVGSYDHFGRPCLACHRRLSVLLGSAFGICLPITACCWPVHAAACGRAWRGCLTHGNARGVRHTLTLLLLAAVAAVAGDCLPRPLVPADNQPPAPPRASRSLAGTKHARGGQNSKA